MNRRPAENTPRVIGLAIAFFGLFAAIGFASGLHEKLASEELIALALFAVGYTALTLWLDRGVRAEVGRWLRPWVRKAPGKSPGTTRAAI